MLSFPDATTVVGGCSDVVQIQYCNAHKLAAHCILGNATSYHPVTYDVGVKYTLQNECLKKALVIKTGNDCNKYDNLGYVLILAK